MKNIGIIAEYNPFHNGHQYQINKVREILNPDLITVAMSQDVIQRGSFASFDKWWRTQKALESGVDLVFGLPYYVSSQSAEAFADGAVKLLASTGITHLAFGAETDDLKNLQEIATYLISNEETLFEQIKDIMRQGINFPVAREMVLNKNGFNPEPLSKPNNILAIEYLKTISSYNYPITPVLIPRKESEYHDTEIKTSLASASAIRKSLETDQKYLNQVVPYPSDELISNFKALDETSLFASFIVRLLHSNLDMLNNIVGFNDDRAHQFINLLGNVNSFEDIFIKLKSKNITRTAINRMVMNFLLNYTKQSQEKFLEKDFDPYLRILGFNKTGQAYLKEIEAQKITNLGKSIPKLNDIQKQSLELDVRAANMRSLFLQLKEYNKDYLNKPVIM